MVGLAILVGVVLVGVLALFVVLLVHVASVVLGLLVGPDLVVLVHAVGLGELVDFATNEASKELLCEGMVNSLACRDFSGRSCDVYSADQPSLRWWFS